MERMCEVVKDSEYYATQHFISESPWGYQAVMNLTSSKVAKALGSTGSKIGLLIDESGHAKKGKQSVGVGRQYSGTLGKVDNCQVGVYCALSSDKYYSIVDTALYLPKEWTEDEKRCQKAGIPEEHRKYKTKLSLALELVKRQKALGIAFDYVGGDGLYGNNYALIEELDKMGITAVFDVHTDQYIYTEPPVLHIPENNSNKGRKASRVKTDSKAIKVKDFHATIGADSFREVIIRQGTKGVIKSQAYYQTVYTWNGHCQHYNKRTLLIRITQTDGVTTQVKYALSNASTEDVTLEELTQMQAQRYFVERSFQESKQDLGLSQYQVRGWLAWHHHMALCIMAQGYVLEEKMLTIEEFPLLSAYDVREAIINTFKRKNDSYEEIEKQIKARHRQREPTYMRKIPTNLKINNLSK